jgi:hypothetical protein
MTGISEVDCPLACESVMIPYVKGKLDPTIPSLTNIRLKACLPAPNAANRIVPWPMLARS